MSVTYIIPCNPIAWKRAGNSRGRFYDQQSHTKINTAIYIKNQHDGTFYENVPLLLTITFYFPIPQTWSKKRKETMVDMPHIFIPDTDNCVKFILDCLSTVIFKDDCQVSDIIAKKRYDDGNGPRTEFTLTVIK
jgi:Holliday junction resolvase RusA-like endonuclease